MHTRELLFCYKLELDLDLRVLYKKNLFTNRLNQNLIDIRVWYRMILPSAIFHDNDGDVFQVLLLVGFERQSRVVALDMHRRLLSLPLHWSVKFRVKNGKFKSKHQHARARMRMGTYSTSLYAGSTRTHWPKLASVANIHSMQAASAFQSHNQCTCNPSSSAISFP